MPIVTPRDHAQADEPAAVEIRRLRLDLGDRPILRGIDLAMPPDARLALVGPNGAGKSTLLRVVAGLLRPSSGDVTILGRSILADPWHARRAIGLVGHQPMLHPDLTVQENLETYARLYGLDEVAAVVESGLRQVGLLARAKSRTSTLSRGMLQRVSIARALLHDPPILLLDEAETGLDRDAHRLLRDVLDQRGGARAVIFASHDLAYVAEVASQVAFLRSGRVAGLAETTGGPGELQVRYAEALASRPTDRRAAPALATG